MANTLGLIAAVIAALMAVIALVVDLCLRVLNYLQKQKQDDLHILMSLEDMKADNDRRDLAINRLAKQIKDIQNIIRTLGLFKRETDDT